MIVDTHNPQKAWLGLGCIYIVLCYFALHHEWGLDFASYYIASNELVHGGTPYEHGMKSIQLWMNLGVPANPNPPITLWLFSFFSYFSYPVAFCLWLGFSTALGLAGLYKALQCVCPKIITEKEYLKFLLLYVAAFPVMMNTIMLQFGGVMLFFLAMGYACYLKKEDSWAGFWWGSLIALKLFPGLLLIYALLKKQFRLAGWLMVWSIGLSIFPLFFLGADLYKNYVQVVSGHIFWYGVNWNMSIMGFLFRVLVQVVNNPLAKTYDPAYGVGLAKGIYAFLVVALLSAWVIFFNRLEKGAPHKGLSCVLVLMILVSPFGWLYYAPLLLIPLLCTFNDAMLADSKSSSRLIIWFLTLFCLYFPMPVTHAVLMPTLISKLGFYSVHFYGLLGLAFLTSTLSVGPGNLTLKAVPLSIKQGMRAVTYFSLIYVMIRCVMFLVRWVGVH